MDYEQLGRTCPKVGRFALGPINFGIVTNEADSFAIMDEAVDSGINLLDSATSTAVRSLLWRGDASFATPPTPELDDT